MSARLQITLETLAKSRNDASTSTLLAALDSPDQAVHDGVVLALVRRTGKAGHLAVLKRWHKLPVELKRAIDESQGRMGGALREALLSDDQQLFDNACEVAHESGEFDLAPTLITLAEQGAGARSDIAIKLVTEMVDRLLRATEDNDEEAGGFSRHPETIRRCVLESLERSVERFPSHGRQEMTVSFVALAGAESSELRRILEAPHHACHQAVVDVLEGSQHPDVVQLLVDYLANFDAPPVVRHVAARRTDDPFVQSLLAMPIDRESPAQSKNLAAIRSLACLASPRQVCKTRSPEQQAAAMRLVAASGVDDEAKLDFAAALLAHGSQPGRLAACESLVGIAGQRSNDLVMAALADADSDVQAAAVRQLRDRHIPGIMATLIELVSSPHEAVREAARDSLTEFSFHDYIARYETLEDDQRRSTGALVAMVDVNAVASLREEMESLVRRRRLRAIEAAEAMGVTAEVADALVERLQDEDHMVRASAAAALATCTALDVRDALLQALGDRSAAVQNAARDSLLTLGVDVPASAGPHSQERFA